MSRLNPNIEGAIRQGKAEGFEVIQSTPTTLQIDIDTANGRAQFEEMLPFVTKDFKVIKVESWKSKSGNDHYLLTLAEEAAPLTRVALQAILGSDPKRELFAIGRIFAGHPEPSLLFKPKGEVAISRAEGKLVSRTISPYSSYW